MDKLKLTNGNNFQTIWTCPNKLVDNTCTLQCIHIFSPKTENYFSNQKWWKNDNKIFIRKSVEIMNF